MPHCSQCYAATTTADTFCPLCGTRQEKTNSRGSAAALRCAGCNAPLQAGDRFCAGCGAVRDGVAIPFVAPLQSNTPSQPSASSSAPSNAAFTPPPVVVASRSTSRPSRAMGLVIGLIGCVLILPALLWAMMTWGGNAPRTSEQNALIVPAQPAVVVPQSPMMASMRTPQYVSAPSARPQPTYVQCHGCGGTGICDQCHGTGKGPFRNALGYYEDCDLCHTTGKCGYCEGTGRLVHLVCSTCNGSGHKPVEPCIICHGTGTSDVPDGLTGQFSRCSVCGGSGNDGGRCGGCHGSGYVDLCER